MSGLKKTGPAKRAPKSRRRPPGAVMEINDDVMFGKDRRRGTKWSRTSFM